MAGAAPMLNATRTELDFLENLEGVIETDPDAGWVFVCDNFNTHMSELKQKILDYIAFYNQTAKPMKWKYDGKIKNNPDVTNVI